MKSVDVSTSNASCLRLNLRKPWGMPKSRALFVWIDTQFEIYYLTIA